MGGNWLSATKSGSPSAQICGIIWLRFTLTPMSGNTFLTRRPPKADSLSLAIAIDLGKDIKTADLPGVLRHSMWSNSGDESFVVGKPSHRVGGVSCDKELAIGLAARDPVWNQ